MYRLSKEFRFEASHQLLRHDGKCQRMHGHSWRGFLICEGNGLIQTGPKENMLVDYGDMGAAAKELEALLDHRHLNEIVGSDMPTSEYLARWCFFRVHQAHPTLPLTRVVIAETCTSECEFIA